MNDYGQTPLDLARAKGHASVVRAIEVSFYMLNTIFCRAVHSHTHLYRILKQDSNNLNLLIMYRGMCAYSLVFCGNFMDLAFWNIWLHSCFQEKCRCMLILQSNVILFNEIYWKKLVCGWSFLQNVAQFYSSHADQLLIMAISLFLHWYILYMQMGGYFAYWFPQTVQTFQVGARDLLWCTGFTFTKIYWYCNLFNAH